MTEAEVSKHFGEPTHEAVTDGCVAYRYEPYLFDEGSPTLFITLLMADGKVASKWFQPKTPDRPACKRGITRLVDVGDIMYKDVSEHR